MKDVHTWKYQNYDITTNTEKFDIEAIHSYLTRSTWAEGIDIETVRLSIYSSLCFGLFDGNKQIGFARVVTDFATFGYLCDVFVLEEWQQLKLGRWLMKCCLSHPVMTRLRRIMLVTSTAPWLYEKMGYEPVNRENFVWQIVRSNIYSKPK